MSGSKINKIVRLGTEYRLPLAEGKKSFDLTKEDYKKYEYHVVELFYKFNKDMEKEVRSAKISKTKEYYDYCYKGYLSDQNNNSCFVERRIKDNYLLIHNQKKLAKDTSFKKEWLDKYITPSQRKIFSMWTKDCFNEGRRHDIGHACSHIVSYDEIPRSLELEKLYESLKKILNNKEINYLTLNRYHIEVCLEILFKCMEITSVRRTAMTSKKDISDRCWLRMNEKDLLEEKNLSYEECIKTLNKKIVNLIEVCIDIFVKVIVKTRSINGKFHKFDFIEDFNIKMSERPEWVYYLEYFVDNNNKNYNNILKNFIVQ